MDKLLDCLENDEHNGEEFAKTFKEFGEFVEFEKFIGDELPWLKMHWQLKPNFEKLKQKV